MLSNKSQYILSKIGIPLYKEAKGLTFDHEMPVHFFQKDNILTLHANPVEEYNQKEQNLLEAIINSISSNSRESFTGHGSQGPLGLARVHLRIGSACKTPSSS